MGEFTIELKGLQFFSFHGLYEEERRVGGEFIVDLLARYKKEEIKITSLAQSVNYVSLFEIVKQEMITPQDLLETVAGNITDKAHLKFPELNEIEVYIVKKNPPINSIIGSVAVRLHKVY